MWGQTEGVFIVREERRATDLRDRTRGSGSNRDWGIEEGKVTGKIRGRFQGERKGTGAVIIRSSNSAETGRG